MITKSDTRTVDLFPLPVTSVDRQNTRSAIRFYSEKCFVLPAPLQERYFTQYKLIYWSGEFLAKQLQDSGGYIIRLDPLTSTRNKYRLEYCRNMNRGFILRHPDNQFALSFRQPAAEWNLPAIVLISGANGSHV